MGILGEHGQARGKRRFVDVVVVRTCGLLARQMTGKRLSAVGNSK